MKKLSLILPLLFVCSAGSVFGQETQTISATANIQTAIVFTAAVGKENVDFGTIQDDADAVINPTGGGLTDTNLGLGYTEAEYQVSGSSQASITYGTATLGQAGSTVAITFTPAITKTEDGGSSQTQITSGDNITLSTNDSSIYIGGTLGVTSATGVDGSNPLVGAFNTTDGNGDPLVITVTYTAI